MSFENRFFTTKEMYREYVNKVLCRRIYILGAVFSAVAALAFLFGIGHDPILAAMEGVCLVIIVSVMLFTPGNEKEFETFILEKCSHVKCIEKR